MTYSLTTARYISRYVIPTAFSMLPTAMRSDKAHAMLLAIGMQESRFEHRIQQPIGPARGFWQFERIGIKGVIDHPKSGGFLDAICDRLQYPVDYDPCYTAVMHNDVLACVFARLLLWTVPEALPSSLEPNKGWHQYLFGWRPGKPHRETWETFFNEAWKLYSCIDTDKETP